MDFGHALQYAKNGQKIKREGWNGKNMFVFFGLPSISVNVESKPNENDRISVTSEDAAKVFDCDYQGTGCLAMKTAQDTIQVGWLASQSDMLANDWSILTD